MKRYIFSPRTNVPLAIILTAFLSVAPPSWAQVVSVQNQQGEVGQGMLLRDGGNCYVVMPKHVKGDLPFVSLRSPVPVLEGRADMQAPFWAGLDLAVGVVRGDVTEYCSEPLRTLSGGVNQAAGNARLARILPTGTVQNYEMTIGKVDYLTIEAETASSAQEVFEGLSGSFLFQGKVPVAMAIESDTSRHARLIRVEEIHLNVARWLRDQGTAFARQSKPEAALQPAGFEVSLIDSNVLPVSAETDASNVLSPAGDFVFLPDRPVVLDFRAVAGEQVDLHRVRILSDTEAGYALPRNIRVEVASSDSSRLRLFHSGSMGTDGIFDTGPRGIGTRAARFVITISNASKDGPVGIGQVVFE